jgi:hypothetical protein
MPDPFLSPNLNRPDFYLAAMGRSGSTMMCNWLTIPPDQLVFIEPSFLDLPNARLLRIQLANFGMAASDEEWDAPDQSAVERFERLIAPRLASKSWALKEVLCSQHRPVIDRLAPCRVLISVRNIFDVALSFFEKHRDQDNLHRFSDGWVADYCLRESAGLVELQQQLRFSTIPTAVIRYEDFTQSEAARRDMTDFLGWDGGGATDMHLNHFDRAFEVERHGSGVSSRIRECGKRELHPSAVALAHSIEQKCAEYQRAFGYS